jgi:hypothetical protein
LRARRPQRNGKRQQRSDGRSVGGTHAASRMRILGRYSVAATSQRNFKSKHRRGQKIARIAHSDIRTQACGKVANLGKKILGAWQ